MFARTESSDLASVTALKTATESLTTSAYGWLIFPSNKIIISASYIPSGSNYNKIMLLPENDRIIARGYIDVSSTGAYTLFERSTAYNITYAYIDI